MLNRNKRKSKLKIALMVIVLASFFTGCAGEDVGVSSLEPQTAQNAGSSVDENSILNNMSKSDVDYEKFLSIKLGSSYEDVVAILGEGNEVASNENEGHIFTQYVWVGDVTSKGIDIIVMDNEVINKKQQGLDQIVANTNMEKYKQIQEGMTYDQVKDILGEGVLASEMSLFDMNSKTYTWTNEEFSGITMYFTDDLVETKTHYNLE